MEARPPPLLTADGTPLVGCDAVERAILERLEGSAPVIIAVLFGKPGRGKTSLAHAIGRARSAWFEDINASSERRSEELRQRLSKFLSDGDQHALRARRAGLASLAGPPAGLASLAGPPSPASAAEPALLPSPPPLGVLFLDEADGLGSIGQATVASFLADLEDGSLPARRGWRACVIIACNDMAALHDSVLSRAHVLAEMPRPELVSLVIAARAWIAAAVQGGPASAAKPAEGSGLPADVAAPSDEQLAGLAIRADGDFRAMRQLVSMALAGVDIAGPGGPEQAAAPTAAPGEIEALLPLRCPRPVMRALLTGEGQEDLGLWSDVWRAGHRADVVVQWVELVASDPKVDPERRVRLLRFRAQLADPTRPSTLLQMVGAFARTMVLDVGPAGRPAGRAVGRPAGRPDSCALRARSPPVSAAPKAPRPAARPAR